MQKKLEYLRKNIFYYSLAYIFKFLFKIFIKFNENLMFKI